MQASLPPGILFQYVCIKQHPIILSLNASPSVLPVLQHFISRWVNIIWKSGFLLLSLLLFTIIDMIIYDHY